MDVETPARKLLVREVKEQALERMETAARTDSDYRNVVRQWNERDKLKHRRWRRWEVGRPNAPMLHWDREDASDERGGMKDGLDTVIPAPLDHEWWRQLLRGDFLDVIHDCPFEMHELTTSLPLFDLLQTLNDNQMEVMYYRAIRQESNKQVAKRRGQSERNILKVYSTLLAGLRRKMHERLSPRYDKGLPLTYAQAQFVDNYREGRLDSGRVKVKEEEKKKKKGKKKAAVDSGGDD
jgi:hypothetical protein